VSGTERVDAQLVAALADRRKVQATINARLDEVARLRTRYAEYGSAIDSILDQRLALRNPGRAAMQAAADALAAQAEVPPLTTPPPATQDDTGAYGPDDHTGVTMATLPAPTAGRCTCTLRGRNPACPTHRPTAREE
jgi:hypothetical protein